MCDREPSPLPYGAFVERPLTPSPCPLVPLSRVLEPLRLHAAAPDGWIERSAARSLRQRARPVSPDQGFGFRFGEFVLGLLLHAPHERAEADVRQRRGRRASRTNGAA